MGLWGGIAGQAQSAWEHFKTRPNLRQVYCPVTDAAAEPARRFEAEKSYATIRVVELRLAEAGRYLTDFLPMCACFVRYGEGDGQRTIPVVIGADTIRDALGAKTPGDGGHNLAIANQNLVSKLPVRAGGLTLYTSLCRFRDDSLSRGLLSFASEAAKAVGGEAVAAPLRIATDLTGKLQTLLGSGGVETRFARLDGDALTESGFRLLAAAASDRLGGELEVRDGQVFSGRSSIDDLDYMLLEFRHHRTLVDADFAAVAALPFHAHFLAAMQGVIEKQGKPSEAVDDLMVKLEGAVFASPSLVWRDRFWLIQLYAAARRSLEASYRPVKAAGATSAQLTALAQRQRLEARAGAPVAPLLEAAGQIAGSMLGAPRTASAVPTGQQLAAMASALMAAQPLDDAKEATIEAAALAFAGSVRAGGR